MLLNENCQPVDRKQTWRKGAFLNVFAQVLTGNIRQQRNDNNCNLCMFVCNLSPQTTSTVPRVVTLPQYCPEHPHVLWCITVAPGQQNPWSGWSASYGGGERLKESDSCKELGVDLFHSTSWFAVCLKRLTCHVCASVCRWCWFGQLTTPTLSRLFRFMCKRYFVKQTKAKSSCANVTLSNRQKQKVQSGSVLCAAKCPLYHQLIWFLGVLMKCL